MPRSAAARSSGRHLEGQACIDRGERSRAEGPPRSRGCATAIVWSSHPPPIRSTCFIPLESRVSPMARAMTEPSMISRTRPRPADITFGSLRWRGSKQAPLWPLCPDARRCQSARFRAEEAATTLRLGPIYPSVNQSVGNAETAQGARFPKRLDERFNRGDDSEFTCRTTFGRT